MGTQGSPVLCIVGPTATGKSELGVEVAKLVGGEVISADSMQVYRGMDVGTAKLTSEEMQGVPHHLLDVVNPDEPFSVAEWVRLADQVIVRLHQAGKLPIVVGGTGLYIRAITEDLSFAEHPGSEEVRAKWAAFADEHGNEALHAALRSRDEQSAERLHPNDRRRVIRALEVYELQLRPLSESYDWRVKGGRYHTVQFGVEMDRQALYGRVERRVDQMLRHGLVEEVRHLLDTGYARTLTSMQAIGYKEMAAYVAGEISLDQAVADIKQATRRFVKRQFSWFRRDPRVFWLSRTNDGVLRQKEQLYETACALAGIPVQGRE